MENKNNIWSTNSSTILVVGLLGLGLVLLGTESQTSNVVS